MVSIWMSTVERVVGSMVKLLWAVVDERTILKMYCAVVRFSVRLQAPRSYSSILHIPSRTEGRTIKAHVYESTLARESTTRPSPVLLNFHGSGFVLPLHGTDDAFCLHIAKHTPYTVLDCSYRLAPRHPFPAGPNDAEDALAYVLAHPEKYDRTRIAVSGFSVGATFALVLASNYPQVKHCAVFYPVTDISIDPSQKSPPESPLPCPGALPEWLLRIFDDCYTPPGVYDRRLPRVSPYHADAATFCDDMLIVTCGMDVYANEGDALRQKLRRAESEGQRVEGGVRGFRLDRTPHAWDKQLVGDDASAKRERAYGACVEMLNGGSRKSQRIKREDSGIALL